jgi:hypothetical protein
MEFAKLLFFIQKDLLEVHGLLLEKLRRIICRSRIECKSTEIILLYRLRFPDLVLVFMHNHRPRRL